jgi:hypothetical protein
MSSAVLNSSAGAKAVVGSSARASSVQEEADFIYSRYQESFDRSKLVPVEGLKARIKQRAIERGMTWAYDL